MRANHGVALLCQSYGYAALARLVLEAHRRSEHGNITLKEHLRKAARQRYILQGLPEVGPARAAQLLASFKTVQSVMTADQEDLTSVPGIGKHVARRIAWAVKEAAPVYSVVPAKLNRQPFRYMP